MQLRERKINTIITRAKIESIIIILPVNFNEIELSLICRLCCSHEIVVLQRHIIVYKKRNMITYNLIWSHLTLFLI